MIVFDKEPAYVLHCRPYRETGSLVQFLTLEQGRVTAVAKQSSRLPGRDIQPFIPALLRCSGRGELLNLREFDPQGKAVLLKPEDQMVGMYVNELITRLVPLYVSSRRLFGHYADTLQEIPRQQSYELLLRKFELKLLEIAGHGLQLEHDYRSGDPLSAGAVYRYTPGEGPTRCDVSQTGQGLYHGKTLLSLGHGLRDSDLGVLREAKELLRTVISYHLKGRELHTRSVFRYLQVCGNTRFEGTGLKRPGAT